MRYWFTALSIIIIGGAISWIVIGFSFSSFFISGGSQPSDIWGPAIGRSTTLAGTALLLLAAAFARRRWAVVSLAAWAAFLTFSTHRVVDRSDGAAFDQWLGVTMRTLPADLTVEPTRPRCTVATWTARCIDESGRGFTTVSPLPMAPLSPGRWDDRA